MLSSYRVHASTHNSIKLKSVDNIELFHGYTWTSLCSKFQQRFRRIVENKTFSSFVLASWKPQTCPFLSLLSLKNCFHLSHKAWYPICVIQFTFHSFPSELWRTTVVLLSDFESRSQKDFGTYCIRKLVTHFKDYWSPETNKAWAEAGRKSLLN